MVNDREINKLIKGKYTGDKIFHKNISKKGINELSNELTNDIYIKNEDNSLKDRRSLSEHYRDHVLKSTQKRTSRNKEKYDYMTIEDYYNYACHVMNKPITIEISKYIKNKDEIRSMIYDFINESSSTLKLDYGLVNKNTNEPIFAIFNKPSEHNNQVKLEMCLVDKNTNEPITIYCIRGNKFLKYMEMFLQ